MWKKLKILLLVFFLVQVAFSTEQPLPRQSIVETLSKPISSLPAFIYNISSSTEEPILQIREIEHFFYWALLLLLFSYKGSTDSFLLSRFFPLLQTTYHYLRKGIQKSQCHPPTTC